MKTLGFQTAKLVTGLHDRNQTIFTLSDATAILSAPANVVSNLLGKAQDRGVVTRLRRGTYTLVPFELGSETTYAGDPLLVADRLFAGRLHYLSHGTAMAIHGMTVQPRLLVTVSAVRTRAETIVSQGTEIRSVSLAEDQYFGVEKHWVTGSQPVDVSDIERTVVDGLRRPELCGGYSEIDLGAWMTRSRVNPSRMVDYALRLGVKAVLARLGYLLDSCKLGTDDHRAALKSHLTRTFHLLDPSLPNEGRHDGTWHLRLNVEKDEIEGMRST